MKSYETVTAALQDLRQRGYTTDFNLQFDCIQGGGENKKLKPEEFDIEEVYRFEGETDPGDENIIYAIRTLDGTLGTLMHGYGVYAEDVSDDMIRKLGTK
ncbi:hypothetical protein SAMN05444266_103556 [Chitinophaga jiangningensis]|uniref:Phosphoribosylpyrophosphate synthetase n=1 Tax=Chitinophaga jiangningensis TaxID=1419482 RepID=A0A1M7B7N0_9BACT|nr:hypothetical protein [Chitinophaga jiangningensis]SHL50886.1 hypothetical protein SAMN05444266_103556 [Chitinophaga jiangningensis]